MAREIFISVKVKRNIPKILSRLGWKIRLIDPKIVARRRFERGPAKETIAVPSSLFSKLYSFIGTGLLHPNLKSIMESAPIGSMCLRGLSVSLPYAFAVGSPSLKAANP